MKKYFYLASLALAFSLGFAASADAPLPPTGITATSTTPTSVDLSWASSTGAVSYQIFRNSTSTPIATTSNLSYVDTGLASFIIYNYYLAAVDASSTVSALSSSTGVKTLADTSAPSVPASLLAVPTSTSQINLSWATSTDNVGVTGYKVYVNGVNKATSSVNNFQDAGLTASTTYAYQISAIDAAGNESEKSATTSATTLATDSTSTSTIAATILIKKGDKAVKLINVRSNQEVKIVILGSADLDVKKIIHLSARFAGAKQHERKYKDYDKDGKMDVIYEFRAKKMTELTNGTSTAIFTAKTKDNKIVSASLTVNVKGVKEKLKAVKKSENKIEKLEKEIKKLETKIEKEEEQTKKVENKLKEVSERKEEEKESKRD